MQRSKSSHTPTKLFESHHAIRTHIIYATSYSVSITTSIVWYKTVRAWHHLIALGRQMKSGNTIVRSCFPRFLPEMTSISG